MKLYSERQYQNRASVRGEQARQIKRDCETEYPDCTHCTFREENGRLWGCKLGTRPKDWRI